MKKQEKIEVEFKLPAKFEICSVPPLKGVRPQTPIKGLFIPKASQLNLVLGGSVGGNHHMYPGLIKWKHNGVNGFFVPRLLIEQRIISLRKSLDSCKDRLSVVEEIIKQWR